LVLLTIAAADVNVKVLAPTVSAENPMQLMVLVSVLAFIVVPLAVDEPPVIVIGTEREFVFSRINLSTPAAGGAAFSVKLEPVEPLILPE
jgi:hypothetical protein